LICDAAVLAYLGNFDAMIDNADADCVGEFYEEPDQMEVATCCLYEDVEGNFVAEQMQDLLKHEFDELRVELYEAFGNALQDDFD
jgi:hypothetical protein